MSEPRTFSDDADHVHITGFFRPIVPWTYTSARDDDGNLVIRINIAPADRETIAESVVAYNMMERIKKQQSATRGGWAAAGSPPVVPQPSKASMEKASERAQTKLHLQALKDISKTTFWWQAQKIAKAMLKDVGKPSDEDGERYMVALEKILRTAHHQEAVGIAAEAQKPSEKQSEVPYDWDD